MGRTSINNGLQIFGGYGFTVDFPLEQYYRDIRIMALYEGTTGIQSLDLMGRKLVMKNGQPMRELVSEFKQTIEAASRFDDLKPYADEFKATSKDASNVIMQLLSFAMSGNHERYISDATIFMEYMSTIVIAWQWLKMATVAKTAMVSGKMEREASFYENKLHTMKFYFKYELPKTLALKKTLLHPDVLTIVETDKEILV
jgi:butyryl-CoA dehydrogenase